MRGWSALLEEPLLRWNQQDWGRGVGREDRNDGAHTRCSSGAFASALHVLCTSPWLAFPPLPVYGILCHFFTALISSPAEGGRRLPPSGGGDCLGSQPWGSQQGQRTPSGHLLCPHPIVENSPCTPRGLPFQQPSSSATLQGPDGTDAKGCGIQPPLTSQVGKLRPSDSLRIPRQVN